jgi:hypothetical protein
VSRLEDLLLVLLLQVDAIVDVVLLHGDALNWLDSVEWVSVLLNDRLLIKLNLTRTTRAASSSCATTWLHEVRKLLNIVRLKNKDS